MGIRRRYSPQKKQEQISRKQFEEYLEHHEWITGDIEPDLGEDILVRIYEGEISTGLSLYVQLKSVQAIENHRLASGIISYGFEVSDLDHWETQAVPVLLVIWDIHRRMGWWILVADAVNYLDENSPGWRDKDEVNVHIPVDNILDENGLKRIRFIVADHFYPIVSKDKDFKIHAQFEFPPTPEGKAKLTEFQRFIAAGDELELDGRYIGKLDLPDWWVRLYGGTDLKSILVRIGPTRLPETRPVQMDFFSPKYGHARLPNIELRTVKAGQEEFTITNDHQNIAAKFHFLLNMKTHQYTINITLQFENVDGFTALEMLKIQRILSSGGTLQVTPLGTEDATILQISPEQCLPPSEQFREFVEKICFIQEVTGKTIKLRSKALYDSEDVKVANELISIFRTGRYRSMGVVFTAELKKPAIELMAEVKRQDKPQHFQLISEESFNELLSTKIDLGPMTQYITGKWEISTEEVNTWLEQASENDALKIRLVDVELVEEFDNWMK